MLAKDVSVNDLLYRQYEFSKDVRSLQQLVVRYKLTVFSRYVSCVTAQALSPIYLHKVVFT